MLRRVNCVGSYMLICLLYTSKLILVLVLRTAPFLPTEKQHPSLQDQTAGQAGSYPTTITTTSSPHPLESRNAAEGLEAVRKSRLKGSIQERKLMLPKRDRIDIDQGGTPST